MSFFSPRPLYALGLLPATVWQVIIQCFVKVKVKNCCTITNHTLLPSFHSTFCLTPVTERTWYTSGSLSQTMACILLCIFRASRRMMCIENDFFYKIVPFNFIWWILRVLHNSSSLYYCLSSNDTKNVFVQK